METIHTQQEPDETLWGPSPSAEQVAGAEHDMQVRRDYFVVLQNLGLINQNRLDELERESRDHSTA